MLIRFAFTDWHDKAQESLYSTEKGVELSMGSLHHGTVFNGELYLDTDTENDLKQALRDGYHPVFTVCDENIDFQQVLNVRELIRDLRDPGVVDGLDGKEEHVAKLLEAALEVSEDDEEGTD